MSLSIIIGAETTSRSPCPPTTTLFLRFPLRSFVSNFILFFSAVNGFVLLPISATTLQYPQRLHCHLILRPSYYTFKIIVQFSLAGRLRLDRAQHQTRIRRGHWSPGRFGRRETNPGRRRRRKGKGCNVQSSYSIKKFGSSKR